MMLKLIQFGAYTLIALTLSCSSMVSKKPETVKIGPDAKAGLVIYFKQGTTEDQIADFNRNYINIPRADGRGDVFRDGISGYLRLLPSQANGHDAIAITFKADASSVSEFKRSIASDGIVDHVFENVSPNDIG